MLACKPLYRPEAKPKGGLPRVFSCFLKMGMTSPVSKNYVIGFTVATLPLRPDACASMVNRKPPLVNIPLRVMAQLLMRTVRDSNDSINSDRLGTHSAFAAHCLHRI